jgi:hypothetical protein
LFGNPVEILPRYTKAFLGIAETLVDFLETIVGSPVDIPGNISRYLLHLSDVMISKSPNCRKGSVVQVRISTLGHHVTVGLMAWFSEIFLREMSLYGSINAAACCYCIIRLESAKSSDHRNRVSTRIAFHVFMPAPSNGMVAFHVIVGACHSGRITWVPTTNEAVSVRDACDTYREVKETSVLAKMGAGCGR